MRAFYGGVDVTSVLQGQVDSGALEGMLAVGGGETDTNLITDARAYS